MSLFSQDYLGSSPCQLTYHSALAPSGASPPTTNTWHNIPSNAEMKHRRSTSYKSLIIPCLAPLNTHGRHSTRAPRRPDTDVAMATTLRAGHASAESKRAEGSECPGLLRPTPLSLEMPFVLAGVKVSWRISLGESRTSFVAGGREREVWKCFVPPAAVASMTLAVLLGAPLCHMAPPPTSHLPLPRTPTTCYHHGDFLLC